MPAAPLAWFRQQCFDNNGDPLASGTLEFYDSGTSTPRAVFSDADLSVSAGTTVTLNSAGFPTVSGSEVTLFLSPVAYRVIVKNSAGTTLRTVDGVYALQAASSVNLDISDAVAGEALSAGDLCYLSDGSASLTAGRWYRADADLYYASIHPQLGFATAAISSGGTGTIRIGGVMTGLSGLSAGSTYYVSATAAALTATAPMNARSVGVAITAATLRIDISDPWLANGDPLSICDGRLTLTTALPVTTSDVTAAGTIYFTPYKGNRVALFDGNKWKVYPFTEVSLALTATSGKPYDVWLYDNAGTLTLEILVWTNDTTRATALALQNGVPSKTGALTRRYLGSFYATASNQTEDSFAKRNLFNYYNRVDRPMAVFDGTDSWTYSTLTYRQANGAAANQLELMVGVSENAVDVGINVTAGNDTGGAISAFIAVGLDSTTTPATNFQTNRTELFSAGHDIELHAFWRGFPGVGRHTLVWLEKVTATGITTWSGDNGQTDRQSGITGVTCQ